MTKDSRISFRISDDLNEEIEKIIIMKRDIRDRSDLGNQSIEFYLRLLKNKSLEELVILRAIMGIAEKTGNTEIKEVKRLKKTLDWFEKMRSDPLNAMN